MLKLNEHFRDNEDFNNCLLVNTNSQDLCLESKNTKKLRILVSVLPFCGSRFKAMLISN